MYTAFGNHLAYYDAGDALKRALRRIKQEYPSISYEGYIAYCWSDINSGDVCQYEISSKRRRKKDKGFVIYDFIGEALRRILEDRDAWEDLSEALLYADENTLKKIIKLYHLYSSFVPSDSIERIIENSKKRDDSMSVSLQEFAQALRSGNGTFIVPQCTCLKELLTEYVNLYGKDKWALSTYSRNCSLIENYIEPLIGDLKLSDINTRVLEVYYQKLLDTPAVPTQTPRKTENGMVGLSTIRDIHKLLRSCFEQAAKWELIERNPAVRATVPKYKPKKREIWTADILMHANEVCEDEELKLAMNLAFSGSLRIGELIGLTWDCVDISPEAVEEGRAYIYINKEYQRVSKNAIRQLNGKDILVIFPSKSKLCSTVRVLKTPKTESSIRKIYIPRTVSEMLARQKAEQDKIKELLGNEYQDYGLVMATGYGMPMGTGSIHKRFAKLIEENNLPEVVFHSLRHTSVTYKLKLNRGDIKSVQGDSGHAQVSMVTDVYSHIIDEDRKKNAERFEEAFYGKKNLNPQMTEDPREKIIAVPEGVDSELLTKVLNNPEMAALLSALAKSMPG